MRVAQHGLCNEIKLAGVLETNGHEYRGAELTHRQVGAVVNYMRLVTTETLSFRSSTTYKPPVI